MIGRKAVIGLSLLSALLLCAIAAQSASAAAGVNTTAFTCTSKAPTLDFEDEHCDKSLTPGKFGHEVIPLNTKTSIVITNEKTKNATKEKTDATLKGIPFGVKTHILCKTVNGTGTLTNTEPKAKEHKVTGEATVKFTECEVKEPTKCTVKEVVAIANAEGVEGLEGKEEMGLEFRQKGEKEPFSEITLEGAECALKGKPFPVTGSAISTSGTGNDTKAQKHTGATGVFTEAMTKKTLLAGGKEAFFTSTATVRMAASEPAISLTTVT